MAKKSKIKDAIDLLVEETIKPTHNLVPDCDLLGTEVIVTEDVVAQINPMQRKKTFLGYHPISGEEVYL